MPASIYNRLERLQHAVQNTTHDLDKYISFPVDKNEYDHLMAGVKEYLATAASFNIPVEAGLEAAAHQCLWGGRITLRFLAYLISFLEMCLSNHDEAFRTDPHPETLSREVFYTADAHEAMHRPTIVALGDRVVSLLGGGIEIGHHRGGVH